MKITISREDIFIDAAGSERVKALWRFDEMPDRFWMEMLATEIDKIANPPNYRVKRVGIMIIFDDLAHFEDKGKAYHAAIKTKVADADTAYALALSSVNADKAAAATEKDRREDALDDVLDGFGL